MPKFSIVIPVWGEYKKYLEQALKSAQEQTYSNFEIVVVEDCLDLPTARNKGIERAIGEYILPLDVDDKIAPTYLEECVEKFREGAEVVYCDCVEFGECWQQMNIPDEISLTDLFESNRLVACSAFKKSDWEEIGKYDENMKDGYEDWDFWLRMMLAGKKFEKIKKTLFFYGKHGESMSSNFPHDDYKQRNYLIEKYAHLCDSA